MLWQRNANMIAMHPYQVDVEQCYAVCMNRTNNNSSTYIIFTGYPHSTHILLFYQIENQITKVESEKKLFHDLNLFSFELRLFSITLNFINKKNKYKM